MCHKWVEVEGGKQEGSMYEMGNVWRHGNEQRAVSTRGSERMSRRYATQGRGPKRAL